MIITYLTKDSYGVCAESNYSANALMWEGRLLEWQFFVAEASGPGGVSDHIGSYWDEQRDKVPDVVHDVLNLEDTPSWVSDVELQINIQRSLGQESWELELEQILTVTRNTSELVNRTSNLYFMWNGQPRHRTIGFKNKHELRAKWDEFNACYDHVFDGMLDLIWLSGSRCVTLYSLTEAKWIHILSKQGLTYRDFPLYRDQKYDHRLHYQESKVGDMNPKIVTCLAELELWSRKLVACKNVLSYEQYLEWEDGRSV